MTSKITEIIFHLTMENKIKNSFEMGNAMVNFMCQFGLATVCSDSQSRYSSYSCEGVLGWNEHLNQ